MQAYKGGKQLDLPKKAEKWGIDSDSEEPDDKFAAAARGAGEIRFRGNQQAAKDKADILESKYDDPEDAAAGSSGFQIAVTPASSSSSSSSLQPQYEEDMVLIRKADWEKIQTGLKALGMGASIQVKEIPASRKRKRDHQSS